MPFARKPFYLNNTAAVLGAAALVCASHTMAQNAPALEEVVVTAQRRSENLQTTPISITALTSLSIERRGIHNAEDLIGTVPSIGGFVAPGSRGNVSLSIRGVSGGSPSNPSVDPTNAIYMDGVYVGKMTGLALDVADVQRIEVLRGPQGTLYGRNSTGGAINFITRKPSGELGVKVTGTAGNESLWGVKTLVDLPAIGTPDEGLGTLATQFGYYKRKRDPFYGNTNPTQHGFDNLNRQAWRFAATWQIRDNLTADYIYDHSDLDEYASLQKLVGVTPVTANGLSRIDVLKQIQPFASFLAGPRYAQSLDLTLAQLEKAVADGQGRPNKGSSDIPSFSTNSVSGHSLTVQWNPDHMGVLGDVTFKSITGYRQVNNRNSGDLDGMDNSLDPTTGVGAINDPTLLYLAQNPGDATTVFNAIDQIGGGYSRTDARTDYSQFSQELQMIGTSDRLDYVVGLFWFKDRAEFESVRGFALPLAGLDDPHYKIQTDARAVYSQATWTPPILDDKLSIDVGLRYTAEEKKVEYRYLNSGSPLTAAAFGLPWNGTLLPQQPSSWQGPPGTVGYTAFATDKYGRKGDHGFANTSGMVNFKYQWTDTLMTYLKYSTGYRSGGYNGETIALPSPNPGVGEPVPFKEEKIKSIEVGIKSDWWDRRLRINGAVYRYKYVDQQVSQIIVDPNTGATSSNIVNAGQSKRWGLELQMDLMPVEDVLLQVTWAHMSGNFDKYAQFCAGTTAATCLDHPENIAQRTSPDNQASFVADWTFLRNSFATFHAHIGTYWQQKSAASALWTGTYGASAGGPIVVAYKPIMLDARTIVNARLTMGDIRLGDDGRLNISLWGKNLTDDDYNTFGINFATLGVITEQYGPPRTYGIDVTYQY